MVHIVRTIRKTNENVIDTSPSQDLNAVALFLSSIQDKIQKDDERHDGDISHIDVQSAIEYEDLLEEARFYRFSVSQIMCKDLQHLRTILNEREERLQNISQEVKLVHSLIKRSEVWMTAALATAVFIPPSLEKDVQCDAPMLNLPHRAILAIRPDLSAQAPPKRRKIIPPQSSLISPTRWTWQEFLRLSYMVTLLPSPEERLKANQSNANATTLKRRGQNSAPVVTTGVAILSIADLVALWVRAQRSTSAWRHLLQLYVIEKVRKKSKPVTSSKGKLVRGKTPMDGRCNVADLQDEYVAAFVGYSENPQFEVESFSNLLDRAVELAVTNQVYFTQTYAFDSMYRGTLRDVRDGVYCKGFECSENHRRTNVPRTIEEAISQFHHYAALVGSALLILPTDPIRNQRKRFPGALTEDKPMAFIVASYLPSFFGDKKLHSCMKDTNLFSGNDQGIFHVLPLHCHQHVVDAISFFERCQRLWKADVSTSLEEATMSLLDTDLVISLTPRQLLQRLAVTKAIDRAITVSISMQARRDIPSMDVKNTPDFQRFWNSTTFDERAEQMISNPYSGYGLKPNKTGLPCLYSELIKASIYLKLNHAILLDTTSAMCHVVESDHDAESTNSDGILIYVDTVGEHQSIEAEQASKASIDCDSEIHSSKSLSHDLDHSSLQRQESPGRGFSWLPTIDSVQCVPNAHHRAGGNGSSRTQRASVNPKEHVRPEKIGNGTFQNCRVSTDCNESSDAGCTTRTVASTQRDNFLPCVSPVRLPRTLFNDDLSRAGPEATCLTIVETAVVAATLKIGLRYLARRLLCPRYRWSQADTQVRIVETLDKRSIPTVQPPILDAILQLDFSRASYESGPIIARDGRFEYRMPTEKLELDVICAAALKDSPGHEHDQRQFLSQQSQHNLSLRHHHSRRSLYSSVLQCLNDKSQASQSDGSIAQRIRGGGPHDDCCKLLKDLPRAAWNGLPVTGTVQTSRNGVALVDATIVGYLHSNGNDMDHEGLVYVDVIFVSNHGLLDAASTQLLPVSSLSLVGEGSDEDCIAKTWQSQLGSGESLHDMGSATSAEGPLKDSYSKGFTRENAKIPERANNCDDSCITQLQSSQCAHCDSNDDIADSASWNAFQRNFSGPTSYLAMAKTMLVRIAKNLPLKLRLGAGLRHEVRFDEWCSFVEKCLYPRQVAQGLIVFLGSVDKLKLPLWWSSTKAGWSKPLVLMNHPTSSALLLHLSVLNAAIDEVANQN